MAEVDRATGEPCGAKVDPAAGEPDTVENDFYAGELGTTQHHLVNVLLHTGKPSAELDCAAGEMGSVEENPAAGEPGGGEQDRTSGELDEGEADFAGGELRIVEVDSTAGEVVEANQDCAAGEAGEAEVDRAAEEPGTDEGDWFALGFDARPDWGIALNASSYVSALACTARYSRALPGTPKIHWFARRRIHEAGERQDVGHARPVDKRSHPTVGAAMPAAGIKGL
jgi:hypothetical protein